MPRVIWHPRGFRVAPGQVLTDEPGRIYLLSPCLHPLDEIGWVADNMTWDWPRG